MLQNQNVQVSWEPADDSRHSDINYIVNISTMGMEFYNFTSVMHPIKMTAFSGLPQYSAGAVSLQAMNPGALSETVSVPFRMVNIVTNGRNENVQCNVHLH